MDIPTIPSHIQLLIISVQTAVIVHKINEIKKLTNQVTAQDRRMDPPDPKEVKKLIKEENGEEEVVEQINIGQEI